MSSSRTITIPGMTKGEDGNIKDGDIKIALDDQDAKTGMAINQRLYQALVNNFINQGAKLRAKEKQFYLVNNQLLQLLLSSKGCTGLLLSKCVREDGEESIAFIALGDDKVPPHWQTAEDLARQPNSGMDIAAGEWIQGYTVDEIKDRFLKDGFTNEIDFKELFTGFASM